MSVDLEKLIAFADNELLPGERADVEAALAADPALRAQLAAQQQLRQRLSAAFEPIVEERVPESLLNAAAQPRSNVVSFAAARTKAPRWSAREWGAMAASLAGGLILGLGVMANQSPTIVATSNGLEARGTLAQALDSQLAADSPGAVRMGVSFRNHAGDYCRTFSLSREQTAGLACKADSAWRIGMTAHAIAPTGEIRTAGSETPPQILAAVEADIDGDPLDAAAEAHARATGWRSQPNPH